MTVEIIRGSDGPFADRYKYDLSLCKTWAQVDTRQDAPYYGTWTDPQTRRIFNYCEGDVCLTVCTTDEEYVAELRRCAQWNIDAGYWLGIDPGWDEAQRRMFLVLGLRDLLHEVYRPWVMQARR